MNYKNSCKNPRNFLGIANLLYECVCYRGFISKIIKGFKFNSLFKKSQMQLSILGQTLFFFFFKSTKLEDLPHN